jgi:acetyl-CoA carboxylase biotin carboxyl carrier protein
MASMKVRTETGGNVWKIVAAIGDSIPADETIMILESMKVEIPVLVPRAGKLVELLVKEGDAVLEDQVVAVIETA